MHLSLVCFLFVLFVVSVLSSGEWLARNSLHVAAEVGASCSPVVH